MKAIETEYGGYRFRSRLEARWAVFFDSLGLQWEYEPEGFELNSGRYLPDFRVVYPGRGAGDGPSVWWFEVKPHLALLNQYDWSRIREFDSEAPLILLDGTPANRLYLRAGEAVAADGDTGLRDGPCGHAASGRGLTRPPSGSRIGAATTTLLTSSAAPSRSRGSLGSSGAIDDCRVRIGRP